MRRISVSVVALALVGSGTSYAASDGFSVRMGAGAEGGSHIVVVPYSETKRREVVGVVGQPTTFSFPQNEQFYRFVQTNLRAKNGSLMSVGSWSGPTAEQVKDQPLYNQVTLWPMVPGVSYGTIFTMTDPVPGGHGAQGIHPLKLVALPDDPASVDDKSVAFNVIYSGGPHAVRAAVAEHPDPPSKPHRRRAAEEELAAKERLRVDAFNGVGGCHYQFQGPVKHSPIEPLCPMDNGQWTLMRFPGLSKKPSVYVVDPGNIATEALAKQHGSGDFVVVEAIAQRFRLRLDQYVVDIINTAYDPAGRDPGTGTLTPSVLRRVLTAGSDE